MKWRKIQDLGPANVRRDDGQLGHAKLDQTGYAKPYQIEHEKLGSDLGRLLGVPVPEAEISDVCEWGRCFISYVHSTESLQLAPKLLYDSSPNFYISSPNYNHSALCDAAKRASGLLPFLVWIAAYDLTDDTNLVVDQIGNGTVSIRAIDFGDAFDWAAAKSPYQLPGPPVLRENADLELVEQTRLSIKQLLDQEIAACCEKLFDAELASHYTNSLAQKKASLPTTDKIISG